MHSAIAHFAPNDVGYVLDVSGAGVLESSAHQTEAQRFVAFLTSAQGQEIIARSDSFEYPIASGVTTAQPETPVGPARTELHHDHRPRNRRRGDQAAARGPAALTGTPPSITTIPSVYFGVKTVIRFTIRGSVEGSKGRGDRTASTHTRRRRSIVRPSTLTSRACGTLLSRNQVSGPSLFA